MKKERGIALTTLIIIIVAILIVGGVATFFAVKGSDKDTDKDTDKEKIESVDKDSTKKEEKDEDEDEKETTQENEFWVSNYKKWGEQKETFTLTLFDGKFTAPIDLKSADNFVKKYGYAVNGQGTKNTNTIQTILNSEDEISIMGTTIWMYYGELNENNSYKDSIRVKVENYNKEDIVLKEAINNNWWYISEDIEDAENSLGIDITDTTYDEESDARPLLNKIIENLGGPSHIYILEKTLDNSYQNLNYWLVYEYNEFVLVVEVTEAYVGESYLCGIGSINYFTKECFEKELEQKDFEIMK